MRTIGAYGMGRAVARLTQVLKQEEAARAVRTGNLMASLRAGAQGAPSVHTVFRTGAFEVEIGTNLVYAAQVHFGGPITPRRAKALAIPVRKSLALQGLGPREIDPARQLLTFVPSRGGKPNVIGYLVDPGEAPSGRRRARRGRTRYGPGVLYVLASRVMQPPRPYLYWDEEDERVVLEELVPAWLEIER